METKRCYQVLHYLLSIFLDFLFSLLMFIYLFFFFSCLTDCRIPAAIIELLHLLPQSAAKFLDLLVTNVIQLEANLPKGIDIYPSLSSLFL